jgi:hypothetical protein
VTAVGLTKDLGLELMASFRTSTTRVRFEDQDRQPFLPAEGDLHHRNETLAGGADPWVMLHGARRAGTFTLSARGGVTLPLAHTVPNPFALGREGLAHQHVQFGTGTWDPVLGLAAGRGFGSWALSLSSLARLAFHENEHGYRAGNRFLVGLHGERPLGGRWRGSAGLEWAREEPERWDGVLEEEEGNLGRTDVLVTLAALHSFSGAGALRFAVSVPIVTRTRGSQIDYPVLLTVGFVR